MPDWEQQQFWENLCSALNYPTTILDKGSGGEYDDVDEIISGKEYDDDDVDEIVSEIAAIQEKLKKNQRDASGQTKELVTVYEVNNLIKDTAKNSDDSHLYEEFFKSNLDDNQENDVNGGEEVKTNQTLESTESMDIDELFREASIQHEKNDETEELNNQNKIENMSIQEESVNCSDSNIKQDEKQQTKFVQEIPMAISCSVDERYMKYDKVMMLQKELKVNMIFPTMALTMYYIYTWCDDNLSPLVIKEGHVNSYGHSDTLILGCPHNHLDCPVNIVITKQGEAFEILKLNLKHKNHEISYRLYQEFKKPKVIMDIEGDHKGIIEGLINCGFRLADIEQFFSGYNNSGINLKDMVNLYKNITQTNHHRKFQLKCEVCEETCNTQNRLASHMELYHLQEMPLTCRHCKVQSVNKQQHREHINSYHKELVPCSECGKVINKESLSGHVERYHTENTNINDIFHCNVCSFQTKIKASLGSHIRKHSEQKSIECKLCDKKFKWVSSMRSHMKAAHSESTKKYICEICTHSFKDSGNLKKHLFTHTQTKPHMCDKCGKGWIRADFLKNHKCLN